MSDLKLDKKKIIKIFTLGTPENDTYEEYLSEYKNFLVLKEKFLKNKALDKTIKCPLTNKKTNDISFTINEKGIMRIECDGSFKIIKPPKYLYIEKEINKYINEINNISKDLGNLKNKLKNIDHTSELLIQYEEKKNKYYTFENNIKLLNEIKDEIRKLYINDNDMINLENELVQKKKLYKKLYYEIKIIKTKMLEDYKNEDENILKEKQKEYILMNKNIIEKEDELNKYKLKIEEIPNFIILEMPEIKSDIKPKKIKLQRQKVNLLRENPVIKYEKEKKDVKVVKLKKVKDDIKEKTCIKKGNRCSPHDGPMDKDCEISEKGRCRIKKIKSSKPLVDEPVLDEPVVDEQVIDEPVLDEPLVDEPVLDEPVVDKPVLDEPVLDEPVLDEQVLDEPVVKHNIKSKRKSCTKVGTRCSPHDGPMHDYCDISEKGRCIIKKTKKKKI